MISTYLILPGILILIVLFVFNKMAKWDTKVDSIYRSELLIRACENSVLDFLFKTDGFRVDDYINKSLNLEYLNGEAICEIEHDLMMIDELDYPVYHFDSKKGRLVVINEKPVFSTSFNFSEKRYEFILDISTHIMDKISSSTYRVIFNKNKRIAILYPNGLKGISFFQLRNKTPDQILIGNSI